MRVNLVTIEDGLNNVGFRKISAYAHKIHPDTRSFYVVTGNSRSFSHLLFSKGGPELPDEDIEAIAAGLADGDIVGFSSMTQYAPVTAAIIAALRRRNPGVYILWGGIHPIIEPEDAIKHADAICTGEGEFAFEKFIVAFREGRSFYDTPSFWFNTPDGVVKNKNLPLMTADEMDSLPVPTYQEGELIFRPGVGFTPIEPGDFIEYNGLTYKTVWSIGCPFKCTYCGNSKFIDYDRNYRKVRHSSPTVIVKELKEALRKHPHISTVQFDDDSFMALPMRVMTEFAALYKKEIDIPFVVTGLIPNYVRDDKQRLLIMSGMNRVRMGIQSGSEDILQFYERPTPVARVREACEILNRYRDYMIPPAFDIILDNPIETTEDVQATLDLIYEMPRPFTLNIFALRVIPNTRLAQSLEERGISLESIHKSYTRPEATIANMLVYAMVICRLPRPVFEWARRRAAPARTEQPTYPRLAMLLRFLYLLKRGSDHLRSLDITVLSGATIRLLWRVGLVALWRKRVLPRFNPDRRGPPPPPPADGDGAMTQAPHPLIESPH
jgi:anaerobic magnesium-protoporphyrin IX monomethyl ester cyclase